MEYWIDVLVHSLDTSVFTPPKIIHSGLGDEVRSNEYGHLFWSYDLSISTADPMPTYVVATNRTTHPHLSKYINIRGPLVKRLAFRQYEEYEEKLQSSQASDLGKLDGLFRHLLQGQPDWVVWFLWFEDEYKNTWFQTVDELCTSVARVFERGSIEGDGFVSMFRKEAYDPYRLR